MFIQPGNEKLSYMGRIDWSNPEEPLFVYPCTCVGMRFTGNRLNVRVRNEGTEWENYLGMILDGRQSILPLPEHGTVEFELNVVGDGTSEHEFLLFKRQDGCHETRFLGVELAKGARLLDMPKYTSRKIEVYGDSVSAGEVAEATAYIGKEDPIHNGEYSNSWYSYAWMTARKLHAQIHDIAQGGIALLDDTGWFHEPDRIGMEAAWDKIRYNPHFGELSAWDFSNYTPQVVIVALGQNDSNPYDYMKEAPDGEKADVWKGGYRDFLRKLRGKYPSAQIICCTTLLYHDNAWDDAIGQVVKGMQDERMTQYLFKRNGKGTPGHLRIPEAEEMARELAAYINSLPIEGWGPCD